MFFINSFIDRVQELQQKRYFDTCVRAGHEKAHLTFIFIQPACA